MSSSLGSTFLLVLVLVLLSSSLSLSSPSFSSKVTSADLDDICSKTKNPSLCLVALKSDPRTAGADFKGLCEISIDLARANATGTSTMLASLVKETTDPKLKERYTSCSENYELALDAFDKAIGSLRGGNPRGLNLAVSAAMSEADDCESDFEEPPAQPPSLAAGNKNLKDLSSIILVVGKRIAQPN